MSDNEQEHEYHGHSVAMWAAVGIILVASALMCIAVVIVSTGLFAAGAVLTLVGVAVGVALSKAGYGADKLLPPGQVQDSGSGAADAPEGTPAAGIS